MALKNISPYAGRMRLGNWWGLDTARAYKHFFTMFEPVAFVGLCTFFVLVNPKVHLVIMVMLFLVFFKHLVNYAYGLVIKLDDNLNMGRKMKIGEVAGIVSQIGPWGLRLNTNKGLHYVAYRQLYEQGYLILTGKEVGGYYLINLSPKQPDAVPQGEKHLMNKLLKVPFIDFAQLPDFVPTEGGSASFDLGVIVNEENHLREFMELLDEWGYTCKILKT